MQKPKARWQEGGVDSGGTFTRLVAKRKLFRVVGRFDRTQPGESVHSPGEMVAPYAAVTSSNKNASSGVSNR